MDTGGGVTTYGLRSKALKGASAYVALIGLGWGWLAETNCDELEEMQPGREKKPLLRDRAIFKVQGLACDAP
jgi:hypothetical protein